MINNSSISDNDSVLTALEMNWHFLNWSHHDPNLVYLISLSDKKEYPNSQATRTYGLFIGKIHFNNKNPSPNVDTLNSFVKLCLL